MDAIHTLRSNRHNDGTTLTPAEREQLLQQYMPKPRENLEQVQHQSLGYLSPLHWLTVQLQILVNTLVHRLLFWALQAVFTLYITSRQIYHHTSGAILNLLYFRNRSAESIRKDTKSLSRLPRHLSVLVQHETANGRPKEESIDDLLRDVTNVAVWSIIVGIPMLSVFESQGVLKCHAHALNRRILHQLSRHVGYDKLPTVRVDVSNHSTFSRNNGAASTGSHPNSRIFQVLILSATDGRETLVDLTKTLSEMSQRQRLSPNDISADLIDAEMTASVCDEPDLLVLMNRGPSLLKSGRKLADRSGETRSDELCLQGYPLWQLRLTEIFHVRDGTGVSYQTFLRALYRFAKAEMRLGR